ncbi:response regulator [Cohnella candidum]|uniref:Response regulator n=1 Tax=Cohnella candidum TaxID=2674991 RepID=A0A3G3K6A7_9BACL|nr:response regulator [Cohnella candidum]AYQ75597.1 response regulator [Cohnella candidum]
MKRILITDDSPIMRRNLNAILSKAGYEIAAEAANGEEAVHAYRKHRPDLVTMDITMPVMDGLETVKRLMKEDPDARIIVISAFDQRNMLFQAMENGAKTYLIKPITADKLLAAVRQQLEPLSREDGGAGGTTGSKGERRVDGENTSSTASANEPSFAVDNRGGQFAIRLIDPLRPGPYTELQTAVQGLLFVKPINIVFQFGDAGSCHPELASALETLIGTIRGAGGSVAVSATRETLAASLRGLLSVPIGTEGRQA